MTWRRRMRRRLLWAGVLLGLALLLAAVTALRFGAWARDEARRVVSVGRHDDAFAR
jgi:hypothetical protein